MPSDTKHKRKSSKSSKRRSSKRSTDSKSKRKSSKSSSRRKSSRASKSKPTSSTHVEVDIAQPIVETAQISLDEESGVKGETVVIDPGSNGDASSDSSDMAISVSSEEKSQAFDFDVTSTAKKAGIISALDKGFLPIGVDGAKTQHDILGPDYDLWFIRAPKTFSFDSMKEIAFNFSGAPVVAKDIPSKKRGTYSILERGEMECSSYVNLFADANTESYIPGKPFDKVLDIVEEPSVGVMGLPVDSMFYSPARRMPKLFVRSVPPGCRLPEKIKPQPRSSIDAGYHTYQEWVGLNDDIIDTTKEAPRKATKRKRRKDDEGTKPTKRRASKRKSSKRSKK